MFSANSSQVSEDRLYVEDVFSTWLYTGNGSTQTITNGIDLAGKGGLVWAKRRDAVTSHVWIDTVRGALNYIESNALSAQGSFANSLTGFTSSGYTVGSATNYNGSNVPMVSWTFREAPKFFDVVTYTGNGTNGRQIAHSLGTTPGCVIIKCTSSAFPDGGTAANWMVWHKDLGSSGGGYAYNLILNETGAKVALDTIKSAASTTFTVSDAVETNYSGATYVAYLFAHDTTSDGIIQCGSYTTTGNNDINLGWEPQWILEKRVNGLSSWHIWDNMRGMSQTNLQELNADLSAAETSFSSGYVKPTATGYNNTYWSSGQTVIYIAIRRGPMRTPTSGTSVFSPVSQTPSGVTTITTGFPVDMTWFANRSKASFSFTGDVDRLRGTTQTSTNILSTNSTGAEGAVGTYGFGYDRMTSITDNYSNSNWGATTPVIYWNFRRAPSFFDEVCVTSGTGTANPSGTGERFKHNLGVVPEMMIWKDRQASTNWFVYHIGLSGNGANGWAYLNTTDAQLTASNFWSAAQTATECSIRYTNGLSSSSRTLVGYLFASCPGVSKVGSYTGNGSSQTINCGFAAGARFVMIKRTDSTGDWYVWDTARGIVAGNDPRLSLNSTAAEVTTDDSVDTDSSGFVVNQLSATNINVSSATYIYLAVA